LLSFIWHCVGWNIGKKNSNKNGELLECGIKLYDEEKNKESEKTSELCDGVFRIGKNDGYLNCV
jgi:hypothetical protein